MSFRVIRIARVETMGTIRPHLLLNNLAPAAKLCHNPNDPYDYGGTQRLGQLRQQGAKLYNLPQEEAATVVQYYQSQGGKSAPQHIQDALPQYFAALDETLALVDAGKTWPQAISRVFNDRLESFLLRSLAKEHDWGFGNRDRSATMKIMYRMHWTSKHGHSWSTLYTNLDGANQGQTSPFKARNTHVWI